MRGGTDQKDQSQASQNSRISSKDPRPASSDESSGEGPRRTTKKAKLRSVTEESKEAGGADDENRQGNYFAIIVKLCSNVFWLLILPVINSYVDSERES